VRAGNNRASLDCTTRRDNNALLLWSCDCSSEVKARNRGWGSQKDRGNGKVKEGMTGFGQESKQSERVATA